MKSQALTAIAIAACILVASVQAVTINQLWINEIHYDNDGADTGEFVELAGLAGTDLSEISLIHYNGSGGGIITQETLIGSLIDSGNGYGFYTWFPGASLQNGPDGIALVFKNIVLQFLSYEGAFAATAGPASGMTSTDIGAFEPRTNPIGHSLQLIGTGSSPADFSWVNQSNSSQGDINVGQTLIRPKAVPDEGSSALLFAPILLLLASARTMRRQSR